ncbi:MAG: hypothetical protein AAF996_06720 [Pseudomonadota bacterium]
MMKLLTNTTTLWILLVLFIVETIGFGIIMRIWDFAIIDEISDPETVRAHIDALSAQQRSVHAWMTATLDVAYPLTYGPLFAGLALRALSPPYAVPAFLVIPVDLIEGVVQVLALTGMYDALWLKATVTPLKLVLFFAAMVIAIVALVLGWRRKRAAKGSTG